MDEGGPGRRRGRHRPARRLHRRPARTGAGLPRDAGRRRTSSRPTGWPPARAWSSPSRIAEAADAVREYLSGAAFGDAGTTCVIEEGLTGPEISVLRGVRRHARRSPFGSAQDHKRIGDGDTGPNTGGMGAYSPVPARRPGHDRPRDGHRHRAHPGRPARPGHRLPRRPLRRPHAHARRPEDARVQHPLRRPRGAGRPARGSPPTSPSTCTRRRRARSPRSRRSPTTPSCAS